MNFFFHVERGADYIRDEIGAVLPDAASAHAAALSRTRELVAEAIKSEKDLNLKSIMITDAQGTHIGRVYATDVVPCDLVHQICWSALS